MKKSYSLIALAIVALGGMIALPTAASAQHHKKHHKRHLRTLASTSTSGDLGTIASFDGTTLVITTANGDVSGTVTDNTKIDYYTGSDSTARFGSGDGSAPTGSGDSGTGSTQQAPQFAPGSEYSCNGGANEGSVDDLVPGTTVHEALVKLTSSGMEFVRIELVE
jgi:hypothetical protein